MKILVRPINTPQGERWQVCLDRHSVSFHTEREARDFVATLESRLQAPHRLPETSLRAAV
ncbi:hypothetical protein A9179_04540 [Pseudomonas alcaligenes]|uniref:DUF2188 domain-containing protein n=1 Tax=Aquipseudomonas alcaligenes TaxID=43263 RepID=A0ABR7RZ81_AQUAC|nr:hypothetical protein [Pseudomonas alcaligenes]MBC9249543.1 hypothetical protein [Pseudomonas alcaligenes]